MRPLRPLAILVAASAVACGGTVATIATSSTPIPQAKQPIAAATPKPFPYRLWVLSQDNAGDTVSVVDGSASRITLTFPAGAVSADFSRLYAVEPGTGGPHLVVVDPHTGTPLRAQPLESGYDLPYSGILGRGGLSPRGHWLVLDGTDRSSTGPSSSRFLVVDTTGATEPKRVALTGDFLFDGVSESGRNLFLLENLGRSGGNGPQYQVRRYDLVAGKLDPAIIIDKTEASTVMTGVGIGHVDSADGSWQYTVYAFGERGPFVHALDLEHGAAYCIDLPSAKATTHSGEPLELLWSLALNHDGTRLYAVNGGTGGAAVIDTPGTPRLDRTATFTPAPTPAAFTGGEVLTAEAKRAVLGGAVVSPDGATLYAVADASVLAIDVATLHLRNEFLTGHAVSSMAISPDGRFLWAVADQGVVQMDLASGAAAAVAIAPGKASAILRVEPVTP